MNYTPIKAGDNCWALESVKPSPGGYAIARTGVFRTRSQAVVHASRLTGSTPPRLIDAKDFEDAFESSSASLAIREACRRIVVEGESWRSATESCGVSFGGVHKALKKVGLK